MAQPIFDRERVIVLGGVIALTALAWLDLWRSTGGMGMDAIMPRSMPWDLADLGAAALMWGIMMVAMMLPSVTPMLLLFSNVQRKRREQGEAATPISLFAAGYLLVWLTWSGLAAGLQWGLQGFFLLTPHLTTTTSALLGAAFLLLAGGYQLTPWKDVCLVQCQSPFGFLMTRWREGASGAFRMGLEHGTYCLGCCWALMGLLFVGGVMNLLWVAALAGFILLEKAVARGPWLSRLAGLALIGWAVYLLQSGLTG